jgi:neopullulanase
MGQGGGEPRAIRDALGGAVPGPPLAACGLALDEGLHAVATSAMQAAATASRVAARAVGTLTPPIVHSTTRSSEQGACMPDVPAWVRDAVFYQVFPDRFAASARVVKPGPLEPWDAQPTNYGFKGGDLLGIVEHLDHIAELGATALYLTPIFQSASNHRYHTYDYLAVDPLLGGDAALRELIDAVHARGMRIVLDGVFNHTGRGFWPFHHVLETGAGSPYRGWFHWDEAGLAAGNPPNAYPAGRMRSGVGTDAPEPGAVDPGADAMSALQRLGYEAWWGMPALPKLNTDEPAVRAYLWGVAEHWLRFGIDGWRLDVPGEIQDRSFWQEFRRRCRAVNPEAYLVGEIWHVDPDWVSGDRFDALMNYPLAEAIIGFVGGPSLNEALLRSHHEYGRVTRMDGATFASRVSELLHAYAPETNAVQLNLLDSHDTPRALSLLGGDTEAMELATLIQASLPGAPCIYYGDEVGVEGGIDPDSRRSFPWDRTRWNEALFDSVRGSLAARHAHAELRSDELRVTATEGSALVFRRGTDGGLAVALNAGDEPATLPLDGGTRGGTGGEVVHAVGRARQAGSPAALAVGDGGLRVTLPARSGAIIRVA